MSSRDRDCGAVYNSDVYTQLGANESAMQHNVHSLGVGLDRSLEAFVSFDRLLIFTRVLISSLVINVFAVSPISIT